MLNNDQGFSALRMALRMYLFVGVVLVAAGVRSWRPPVPASYLDQALWAVSEVVFWPKVFPHLADRKNLGIPRTP